MDIESLRIELGAKTVADLSRLLGVSRTYLHDLAAGRRRITLRFAHAVERETGRTDIVAAVVKSRTAA